MSSILHNIATGMMEEMLSVVPAGGDDEGVLTCKSNKVGDPAKGPVENKSADVDANNIKGILRKKQEDDDGKPHHNNCACMHCEGVEVAHHAEKPGSTMMPAGSLPNSPVQCAIKRCTPRWNNVHVHMGDLSPVHLWDGSIARRRKSIVAKDNNDMAGGDTKAKKSSLVSKSKSCKNAKNLEDSLSTVETAELSTSISSSCSIEDVVLRMIEKYSLLEMPSCLAKRKEDIQSIQDICSDNNTWQSYARFREEVENGEGLCSSTNSKYHQLLLQEASSDLRAVAHKISYPYPKCIGAYMWPKCVHTRINGMSVSWECAKDVEVEPEEPPKIINLDMTAMVFSPFAIPRAIQLRHAYTTSAQTQQRDGIEVNMEVVEASWNYRIVDLCAAKRESRVKHGQWKALASVQLDGDRIVAPKMYDASGINHRVISKIRKWLLGTKHDGADAEKILSDFDLFRLIFATMFTSLTPPLSSGNEAANSSSLLFHHSIGRPWPSNSIVSNEDLLRIAELELGLGKEIRGTSWLEYEVRMATGHLRDQDQYFEV